MHGTTALRPVEHFKAVEQPALLPTPTEAYDLPHYATAKVHRDHHIEVAKALYSVPGNLIGRHVEVRADRQLVKIFHRGQLVKTHPRQGPGGRSTDAADLPSDKTVYALRDLMRLEATAASHGPAIGTYAATILDHPLPWTKMRQVYALFRPREEVGTAAGKRGLRESGRGRSVLGVAHRAHARASHRGTGREAPGPGAAAHRKIRPPRRGLRRLPSKIAGTRHRGRSRSGGTSHYSGASSGGVA